MPRKKQKGDELPDGGRGPQGTGKKKGRPKKVNQNKPGEYFDTRKKKAQVVYEFEIHKVWPSGQAPMVGVTRSVTPEALGQTFGGGVFEAHKRHVDTKELVDDPVIIEIDTGLFPEQGIDPIFRRAGQQQAAMPGLWGGQGWQGPQAGNYPYTPQVMPWGMQPPDGSMDTQDDSEVEDLRSEIREMKDVARSEKAAQKDQQLLALIGDIKNSLNNPQAGGGNSNNPLDIIRLMHEMNGPGAGKTDWIQMLTAAIPLMGGVKNFIADLVKSKASSTSDMSQDMLKSLMEVAEKYMSNKAAPPVPPVAPPPAVPVNNQPPPKPEFTADQQMIIKRKELIENLKRLSLSGQPAQAAAQWIHEQKGPFWNLIKDEIKDVQPDGVLLFVLSETKGEFPKTDEEKKWLKEAVELYLNDFPVAT